MNIYESMRNKRKMVEKIRRVHTTLPNCQLLSILDYQTCSQIKVETLHFNPIVGYTNYLIYIFMNIDENIRNKRKNVRKFKGVLVQHNPYVSC